MNIFIVNLTLYLCVVNFTRDQKGLYGSMDRMREKERDLRGHLRELQWDELFRILRCTYRRESALNVDTKIALLVSRKSKERGGHQPSHLSENLSLNQSLSKWPNTSLCISSSLYLCTLISQISLIFPQIFSNFLHLI